MLDLQQAYELQGAVSALRVADGDRVVGYKVGCTGPGTTAQFGMAGPIRGYLYESEVRRTGVSLAVSDFAQLAVEGEMAIRIEEDGKIAAVFPVIELHHLVFRRPHKTLVELVANNGLNAGIVVPEEEWLSSLIHPDSSPLLTVKIGTQVFESGDLWPMAGGAASSVDWLRQHLAGFGLALGHNDMIITGTPLGLYPVAPGDHVTVFLDDVPMVNCRVVI